MTPPPNRPTVLIVDDDELGRLILEGALESENYALLTATDGASALTLAHERRPDVIVLDVMMPDLDGFAVCSRLRADPVLGHVPILFLTTLNDSASRQKGLAAGADEFLSKPVDVVEFRARLQTITRLNRFRRLAEERERFETIFSHAPDAILIGDAAGRVLAANPAAIELGLVTVAEAGEDWFGRFAPSQAEALRDLAAAAAGRPGRAGPAELTLTGSAGPKILEVTAAGLPWAEARALQFTLRDVSDKKRMEAWLMRSQRIELLGQFAGEIVHDVNNLLSTVVFGAARLSDETSPQVREQAARIEAVAMRAGAVLRRILQFARGSETTLASHPLADATARCAELVEDALGDRITLRRDLERDGLMVRLDEHQLHQLLLNLCLNARDAMGGKGMIALSVRGLTLSPEEAAAAGPGGRAGRFGVLSVRDFGPGMSAEVKARLFEPFFTTKGPGKGTGLGLAAVARIMQSHGGFVTLESAPGSGACFHCHFPLAPDQTPETSAPLRS